MRVKSFITYVFTDHSKIDLPVAMVVGALIGSGFEYSGESQIQHLDRIIVMGMVSATGYLVAFLMFRMLRKRSDTERLWLWLGIGGALLSLMLQKGIVIASTGGFSSRALPWPFMFLFVFVWLLWSAFGCAMILAVRSLLYSFKTLAGSIESE